MKRAKIAEGLTVVLALVAGIAWLTLARSGGGGAAGAAEQYFAKAVAGDQDGTYAMLDSVSRAAITKDQWQQQNASALAGTGVLKGAKVTSTESIGVDESYVSVPLEFEGHDPLDVSVRMVREHGEWHPSLSVAQPPPGEWQHVEPN